MCNRYSTEGLNLGLNNSTERSLHHTCMLIVLSLATFGCSDQCSPCHLWCSNGFCRASGLVVSKVCIVWFYNICLICYAVTWGSLTCLYHCRSVKGSPPMGGETLKVWWQFNYLVWLNQHE